MSPEETAAPGVAGGPVVGPVPDGELTLHGRVLPASNATFVGEIDATTVVYKPVRGEKPLWDFPDGTLAAREVAAHAVSEALGWHIVPPTVLREGPHGPGMVQVWCEEDQRQSPVDLVPTDAVPAGARHVLDGFDAHEREVALVHEDTAVLRRMAVFDVVVNNADRKGGHVLAMPGGHRHGVDHGLTFHVEHKLRTVLWGWAGEPLTREEVAGLDRVVTGFDGALGERLADLLAPEEVEATRHRAAALRRAGCLPLPRATGYPAIPWPPF